MAFSRTTEVSVSSLAGTNKLPLTLLTPRARLLGFNVGVGFHMDS